MKITEVNIKLPRPDENRRLLAYASAVFDGDFVVHDLKLVQGNSGVILSMPYRSHHDRCPVCKYTNDLRDRYCGGCGHKLDDYRLRNFLSRDEGLRERVDVFHPLNNAARSFFRNEVMSAYEREVGHDLVTSSGGARG